MVNVVSVKDFVQLVDQVGVISFFEQLIDQLDQDFKRWAEFTKSPRHAIHVDGGVMEVMPTADSELYACKFVNGHPKNTYEKLLTVTAFGWLASNENGYPQFLSEMTLLTAFRTAAASALASKYLSKKDVKTFGIIGTGAQSEFQVLAHAAIFELSEVRYFDVDHNAMKKFAKNLESYGLNLVACHSAQEAAADMDIVTTATAAKKQAAVINRDWLKPGVHVNAIGGDCPGKTEMTEKILKAAKIVVEYLPQTEIEGEIQQVLGETSVYAELWEVISGKKAGRTSCDELTLFDSVGFAVEDYSVLKLVQKLCQDYGIGTQIELIPSVDDPKNLFGLLKN